VHSINNQPSHTAFSLPSIYSNYNLQVAGLESPLNEKTQEGGGVCAAQEAAEPSPEEGQEAAAAHHAGTPQPEEGGGGGGGGSGSAVVQLILYQCTVTGVAVNMSLAFLVLAFALSRLEWTARDGEGQPTGITDTAYWLGAWWPCFLLVFVLSALGTSIKLGGSGGRKSMLVFLRGVPAYCLPVLAVIPACSALGVRSAYSALEYIVNFFW